MLTIKVLAQGKFKVVAVSKDGDCPALDFLLERKSYVDTRAALLTLVTRVAELGFEQVPAAWCHEADKENGIYEFIKGDLRLFYFKGRNGEIAVCTGGVIKKGRKVDKSAVTAAKRWKDAYFESLEPGSAKGKQ
jgi:hypothetical protein